MIQFICKAIKELYRFTDLQMKSETLEFFNIPSLRYSVWMLPFTSLYFLLL